MAKKRRTLTNGVRDSILAEFKHLCAMCGNHSPQVHHIDGEPTNNNPSNLLPLCPNCHLLDIHDPTAKPDPGRIALFRKSKDPFVLDSRFLPIWKRIKACQSSIEFRMLSSSWSEFDDLTNFVTHFNMGEYYAEQLKNARKESIRKSVYKVHPKGGKIPDDFWSSQLYVETSCKVCIEDIESFCVEMLRYQGWELGTLVHLRRVTKKFFVAGLGI